MCVCIYVMSANTDQHRLSSAGSRDGWVFAIVIPEHWWSTTHGQECRTVSVKIVFASVLSIIQGKAWISYAAAGHNQLVVKSLEAYTICRRAA